MRHPRVAVVIARFLLLGGALLCASAPWARAEDSAREEVAADIEKLRAEIDADLRKAERLARDGKFKEALDLMRKVQAETLPRFRALFSRLPQTDVPAPAAPASKPPAGDEAATHRLGQRAITDALDWLAAHQSPNGGWEAAGFNQWCRGKPVPQAAARPDGLGKALYDPGVTGLALLAFLRAGYTHRGKHPYAQTVRRGLRYLVNIQDLEGCFGPRSTQQYIYNHACAAVAMVTAYGLTQAQLFQRPAQRALGFVGIARNPFFAWRYGIKPGDNDTSVSGWMHAVNMAAGDFNRLTLTEPQMRLSFDPKAWDGMRAWLAKVTDTDYGRVGYIQRGTGPARPQELLDRFPGNKSEAPTAIAVHARLGMGEVPVAGGPLAKGIKLLQRLPPRWNPADGSIDMYYWYYGTRALRLAGGEAWAAWKSALTSAAVASQRRDTDACRYRGSWDPIGPWGLDGGRVYSTALMTLTLIEYYEHDALRPR